MALLQLIRALVIVFLLAASAVGAQASNPPAADWLRGSGKDLQICLRGEIFDSDGTPATGVKLTGSLNDNLVKTPLAPEVDGHRFRVWIPVNQRQWYSMWFKADSEKNDHVAYKMLTKYELRQAAIDGIKLTLQAPTRHVEVKVVDKGQLVAGAKVKVEFTIGTESQTNTNANGIARFNLSPQLELRRLTAWTDDHRIGGYGFVGSPPRDPNVDVYMIELNKCRAQKLRFVDENGAPVAGINFVIQIATPKYNYVGTNDHSRMTTDAAGEAVYQWFPDWDHAHFYAETESGPLIIENREPRIVDGVAIFKVKKGKPRKHMIGHVASGNMSAGGFSVSMESFQGEQEQICDVLTTFTDPDGSFALDVLPDATYGAYVVDSRWVGNIIVLIPYQSATDKLTSPELSVTEGQAVEVLATSGLRNQPIPNLTINFGRYHDVTWRENGEMRNGVVGPQWWATTNELGIATTHTLPGELNISVYTPRWRTETLVNVPSGKPMKIPLHRNIGEKQIVTGRLVRDSGVSASLVGAAIQIGSLDRDYEDEQTVTCTKDGAFAFTTFASIVGMMGSTQDGQAVGAMVVKDFNAPIELRLRPTSDYLGQLLEADSRPAANHHVFARLELDAKKDTGLWSARSFEPKRIETITDQEGNFTLSGIPIQTKVDVYAFANGDSNNWDSLGPIYFEPGESRPRTISRLRKALEGRDHKPLAARFKETLRDGALSGFRPMIIVAGKGKGVSKFVNQNLTNWHENNELYSFVQVQVSDNAESLGSDDIAFLKERKWPLPQQGHVVAYVLDEQGKELGHLDTDITRPAAAGEIFTFLHQHAPVAEDADARWNAAFAEAKQSNRRVWVWLCQRNYQPCFELARWLDDERELLKKDYVMLKIDSIRDQNAAHVAQRITRGQPNGVHAIFDSSGKMLIDSKGPLGNVAYPSNIEGKNHLRKMLLATRRNLSDAEVDELVNSVGN